LNEGCARKAFVERLTTAFLFARKTQRVSDREIVRPCRERQDIRVARLAMHAARRGERGRARQALFDRVKLLHASGKTFVDIAVQIGADHRTVAKWIKTGFPLHRRRLAIA
jgi:hypothetical protein